MNVTAASLYMMTVKYLYTKVLRKKLIMQEPVVFLPDKFKLFEIIVNFLDPYQIQHLELNP